MESNREDTRPSIIYKTGDMFESKAHCLINPVNTVGVMGAGLALEFKKRYPHMFTVYQKFCNSGEFGVGEILFYKPKVAESQVICLFPTKEHWRDPSKLSYIETGLKAFCKYHKRWNLQSAAFPKLGCGLGGLDWEHHVKPMMEYYLSQLPIMIEIYE